METRREYYEAKGWRFTPWAKVGLDMRNDPTVRDMIHEGFLVEVDGGVMERPLSKAPLYISVAVLGLGAAWWLLQRYLDSKLPDERPEDGDVAF